MNQILSVDMPKNKQRKPGNSNKANIKSVIIFFCIILIIFAIAAGGIGVYSLINNSNNGDANNVIEGARPKISIEVQGKSRLNIIISHDKEISKISYGWNDEITEELTDVNKTSAEIAVDVPSGENILKVNVTDVNGVTQNYSETYTGQAGPTINLERAANKIKVTVTSDKTISYISYNWDDEELNQIQINATSGEEEIDVQEGEHVLNIVAVDTEGNESTEQKTIVGDNEPTLEVVTDRVNFLINASDDEGLTKMTINFNGEDLDEIEIDQMEYSTSIPLVDGENKIIVTVYNKNEISSIQRVRYVKE